MFAFNYLVVFNITNIRHHSFCMYSYFIAVLALKHTVIATSVIYTSSFIWFDNRRIVVRLPKVLRDSLLFQTEQIGCGIDTDSTWMFNEGYRSGWRRLYNDLFRPRKLLNRIPLGCNIFCTCPDGPCGPLSLLYNWYWVISGGKAPKA
jgi:hypothetical protein